MKLATLSSAIVIVISMMAGPALSPATVQAAGLKTVDNCRQLYRPNPINEAYVSCVNNDTYEAMVYRTYRGILGRYPESNKAGFNYWVSEAKKATYPSGTVAAKMMTTAEYKSKPYAAANYSDLNWVKDIYVRVLDRNASAEEAYIQAGSMMGSRGQPGKTKAELAASIIQSKEAKNAPGSVINAPCYIAADACAD